jgi:threonine dehydrogenase-like Zn-dependent dehydrogenase
MSINTDVHVGNRRRDGDARRLSPDEHKYDITLNASDSTTALTNAVLATAPGGRCENMAFFFREVEMPLLAMHLNCIHFRSSLANTSVHWAEVMQLLSSGRIGPRAVQTSVHPLESAADVIRDAGFKPVFTQELVAS